MAAPTLTTEVQKVESWLKTHERLLIVVILALSTLYLGDKFLTGIENRDRAAATQAAQILTIQQTANATLAAQVAIAQKNNQDLIVQLSQQNAILQTQQAQRTVVLTQQVATDKTLPLPDLGNRWAKLAGLNPGDITATTAGISVTPQGALSTTTTLEQLPVAQANVADLSTQNKNHSRRRREQIMQGRHRIRQGSSPQRQVQGFLIRSRRWCWSYCSTRTTRSTVRGVVELE